MDKGNLELFKQAISEGLSEKFDSVVDGCTEEIACSEKHKLAMRTIIYGKADTKRTWSPRMKRIVAILVAAALLLTSCAAIFHDQIREAIEEFFVKLTYSGDDNGIDTIEEVYELTYLPEGYTLEKENIYDLCVTYKFADNHNNIIIFEQRVLSESGFAVDGESGYSEMKEVEEYDVYYRFAGKYHNYVWSDKKYIFHLTSNQIISNGDIELILQGIK